MLGGMGCFARFGGSSRSSSLQPCPLTADQCIRQQPSAMVNRTRSSAGADHATARPCGFSELGPSRPSARSRTASACIRSAPAADETLVEPDAGRRPTCQSSRSAPRLCPPQKDQTQRKPHRGCLELPQPSSAHFSASGRLSRHSCAMPRYSYPVESSLARMAMTPSTSPSRLENLSRMAVSTYRVLN